MQALFLCLAFSAHAATLVKADLATVTFLVAVLIACLAVLAADFVWFAQGALDISLGHAGADALANDWAAPFAAAELIAAAVLTLTNYHQCAHLFAFALRALLFAGFGERNGFAVAGCGVVRLLQLWLLFAGAALQGEGQVSVWVFAAVYGGGEGSGVGLEQ